MGHVKRFIDPAPQTPQPQKEDTWPLGQTPVREPVIITDPEPFTWSPVEGPVTEPVAGPSLPQSSVVKMPEQSVEPRRSMYKRAEPSWLKDYVT